MESNTPTPSHYLLLHCYTVDIGNCHYIFKREVYRVIEGKGLGGKKINRVNVSLSNKYRNKLNMLATSCNMRPTSLAAMLIEKALDDSGLISTLQDEYCTKTAYRVIPVLNHATREIEYKLFDKQKEWL